MLRTVVYLPAGFWKGIARRDGEKEMHTNNLEETDITFLTIRGP